VPSDLVYPDWVRKTYAFTWSPAHRWYHVPQQRPDEPLLLKIYDSRTDGTARLTAHTSFEMAAARGHRCVASIGSTKASLSGSLSQREREQETAAEPRLAHRVVKPARCGLARVSVNAYSERAPLRRTSHAGERGIFRKEST
jgi:hypothetical protein